MIKKLIYGMACLAVFASCSDAGQDLAEPQTNPQGELITFGDGSVSEVDVIDLATIADGQDSVQVCTIVAPTVSDASYAPEYTITLGDATYGINADGQMSVSELAAYVTAAYGKRPMQRDITATLNRWTSNGTTTVKLSSSPFTVKVIPEAPFIDESYYIVGSLDGWTCTRVEDYKMTNGGGDVYDDPVFSVTIPSPGAGTVEFKVIPQSAFNADGTIANWNIALSAQNPVNEGHFDYGNAGGNISFEATADAKFYKIEFNLMEGTYAITPISFSDYIYYAGDWTSWAEGKKELALVDTDNGIYNGYYWISAVDNTTTWGFKFIDADGNWYGDAGNGTFSTSGGNMDPGAAGFYKIEVNWPSSSYTLTAINTVSLVGDVTGDSSWGTDIDMTWDGTCWTYSGHLKSGNFKFRANHDWNGMNWGGSFDNLEVDGANSSIAAEGDYDIKLYPNCPGKAYATVTAR